MSSNKISAACYLPGEEKVLEFKPKDIELFTEIEDYWGKRDGLIFYPFDRNSPAYFFPLDEPQNPVKEFYQHSNDALSKEEYTTSVMMAKLEMAEEGLNKVVLARNELLNKVYDAETSFNKAKELYSDSYCYKIDLGYEQWVGASPELLLHFEEETVYTMALAGTKLLGEDFTDKEVEEQRMVEEFVEEKLQKTGVSHVSKAEKQEANYNNIKHLKTVYTGMASSEQAMELLKHLQPTSAVCGLPRDKSFAFISNFESLNRSFYSGVTGILLNGKATFFVNLRCIRFTPKGVELFAGAGITKDSDAEEEWLETERKLETIKQLL